ncbi:MAG: hypothetical protein JHD16_14105 [Solirubrobacteraceae bacterium]|nr:hypothetical protein [Solirubrobacteraceae bacterium]
MPTTPIIVFDSNPDALQWRVTRVHEALDGASVTPTTSSTAVGLIAESLAPDTLVLVDLLATDRFALDRPGERLIRRLRSNPRTAHVRPVAWSAHTAQDSVLGVRRSGAFGFVAAGRDAAAELAQLREVAAGRESWPADLGSAPADEEAWRSWFHREFGVEWEPWIEPSLCRLATGGDRRALAAELLEIGAAGSTGHAENRMRKLARMVAGEHRNSAAAVATAAAQALVRMAARRPLRERPAVSLSLELGAKLTRTSPSLVRAAGLLEEEVDEIQAMDELITGWRDRRPAKRGAPAADEVREERRWAAGRRAAHHAAGAHNVDEMIDGLLVQLDEALVALDDARQDELYHPEARAAAALRLLEERGGPLLPGVDRLRGGLVLHGRPANQLALAVDLELADLSAFTAAVDRTLSGDLAT